MNETFIINLIIGAVAGIMAGMFGIGGGVVIVPALVLFSNFSIVQANGTSLAALLLPVGVLAVISYYRAGYMDLKVAFYLATGMIFGVVFGSYIALALPTNMLKIFYAIFLIYVSWSFVKPLELWKKYILKLKVEVMHENENFKAYPYYIFLIVGIATGVISGMFGIGGGLFIVPFLIKFLKYHPKKAIGTSLGALLLPVGLPGVLIYYHAGQLNILYALPLALGIVLGAIFGAKIMISLPTVLVKRVYGLFLLVVAFYFIVDEMFFK